MCTDVGDGCEVDGGDCYPGLSCGVTGCRLKKDDPNAHAKSSLVTWSSLTGNTTKGGPSFVFIVVGLLGAAMIAMKVVQRRHRVLLRHHQYSEVDATATRIDV